MTNITLHMADRSVRRPLCILEDVTVKVGKFFIPVDFIVLDIAEDARTPIILGRPFLCTAGSIIDVKQGRLTLAVGYDAITFSLPGTLARPMIDDTCYSVDIIDESNNDAVLDLLEAAIDERELTNAEEEKVKQLVNTSCAIEVKEEEDLLPIDNSFPDDTLFAITTNTSVDPWYADFSNYVVGGELPLNMSYQQRKRFLHDAKRYFWDDPYLFKECADSLYRRCIPQWETRAILEGCHSSSYGSHHGPSRTVTKVLQSGFFWPTLFADAKVFVSACDACQRSGNIFRRHEMPQNGILEVEVFDVWGIDFQ
ncbi:uncharacterized protein LOC141608094 [Silene latifolia]|uniref:uncharacterized protein LOC141608094 n=1 Tax=Silene latifolia TaxID=37657 RepID=UPI003D784871